jgi:hypothetical protein
VFLSRPQGYTYISAANAGTLQTLNEPESMITKEATAQGTELWLQEDVAMGHIKRAEKGGEVSFGPVLPEVIARMREGLDFSAELAILYGGGATAHIGAIDADIADNGTSQTFSITKATWAPGLWFNALNSYVDVYDVTGVTKRNSSGTVKVTAIDVDEGTRQLVLTGTEAELDNVVATDIIIPRGAQSAWFTGLNQIALNTGSLFGIDAAVYPGWKASTYNVGGAKLTMGKVQAAAARAVVRGHLGKLHVVLNTYSWTDLNNDLSQLRQFAQSTKQELDIGTQKISFAGANGTMELHHHPMVMGGEGFIFPDGALKRIGASDTRFGTVDAETKERKMFQELESKNGIRLRGAWDQCLAPIRPARIVKMYEIVNDSL